VRQRFGGKLTSLDSWRLDVWLAELGGAKPAGAQRQHNGQNMMIAILVGIQLEMQLSDALADLERRETDVAIRFTREEPLDRVGRKSV